MIVSVFRSRLKDEARADYYALAPKIGEIAREMPGYISHKVFVAEDGERVTIVEFEDESSLKAWSSQADHVAAKKLGRRSFYEEYSVQVCQVLRSQSFKAE